MIFPGWAFPQLGSLTGGDGGSAVIRRHRQCLRTLALENPWELKDVDSPEDLEKLLKR